MNGRTHSNGSLSHRHARRAAVAFAVGLAVFATGFAGAFFAAGCSRQGGAPAMQYFCPMHPTYVSDRQGDCPICNMRLVPRPAPRTVYVCPMHPEVRRDAPGDCPICHMALVPRTAAADTSAASARHSGVGPAPPAGAGAHAGHASGAAPTGTPGTIPLGHAPVVLDDSGRQLAGVQTAVAEWSRLTRRVRTVGRVTPDERRVSHLHVKVEGFVEKLYVSATGQFVRAGAPAFEFYSPEILASQEEYLRARRAALELAGSTLPEAREGAANLLVASRRRLELLDVPPAFITALERTGTVQRTVTMRAHSSGYVTLKNVSEGQRVEPGTELFAITDLARVWVEADFYENEASLVGVGQPAIVTLPYGAAKELPGRVAFVYPTVDPQSRTLQVRLEFANPDLALKPGMYADVALDVEASAGVVLPESAVLDTGVRQIVFVETAPNRFEPRIVRLGLRSGGRVLVAEGVRAGERAVVRANFLLDSESRLRAAFSGADTAGGAP